MEPFGEEEMVADISDCSAAVLRITVYLVPIYCLLLYRVCNIRRWLLLETISRTLLGEGKPTGNKWKLVFCVVDRKFNASMTMLALT